MGTEEVCAGAQDLCAGAQDVCAGAQDVCAGAQKVRKSAHSSVTVREGGACAGAMRAQVVSIIKISKYFFS